MTKKFVVTLSGTIHHIEDGRTFEQDNLDDAQLFPVSEEIVNRFLRADSVRLYTPRPPHRPLRLRRVCKRCFA